MYSIYVSNCSIAFLKEPILAMLYVPGTLLISGSSTCGFISVFFFFPFLQEKGRGIGISIEISSNLYITLDNMVIMTENSSDSRRENVLKPVCYNTRENPLHDLVYFNFLMNN